MSSVAAVNPEGPVQLILYGWVPPAAEMFTEPLFPPLHLTCVTLSNAAVKGRGSVTVTVVSETHPLPSITSKYQSPGVSPVKSPEAWNGEPSILYVKGATPEATLR